MPVQCTFNETEEEEGSGHRRREERNDDGRTDEQVFPPLRFSPASSAPDSFRFAPWATSSNRREGGREAAHLSGVVSSSAHWMDHWPQQQ